MSEFEEQARTFGARKEAETREARQLAAMRLVCGIDFSNALDASVETRAGLILKIERNLERERLRGMRRHWSYDLNRHIALKQALDRLRAMDGSSGQAKKPKNSAHSQKPNGARRRR